MVLMVHIVPEVITRDHAPGACAPAHAHILYILLIYIIYTNTSYIERMIKEKLVHMV